MTLLSSAEVLVLLQQRRLNQVKLNQEASNSPATFRVKGTNWTSAPMGISQCSENTSQVQHCRILTCFDFFFPGIWGFFYTQEEFFFFFFNLSPNLQSHLLEQLLLAF